MENGWYWAFCRAGGDWRIRSDAELGDGYSDIVVCTQDRVGIVIEIKYQEDGNLEKGCPDATRQIRERRYAAAQYLGFTVDTITQWPGFAPAAKQSKQSNLSAHRVAIQERN